MKYVIDSSVALTDITNNAPAIHATILVLNRALEICLATMHSVYDCVYVALAEREGCELATADDKLVKNLRPSFPFIVPLSSLP